MRVNWTERLEAKWGEGGLARKLTKHPHPHLHHLQRRRQQRGARRKTGQACSTSQRWKACAPSCCKKRWRGGGEGGSKQLRENPSHLRREGPWRWEGGGWEVGGVVVRERIRHQGQLVSPSSWSWIRGSDHPTKKRNSTSHKTFKIRRTTSIQFEQTHSRKPEARDKHGWLAPSLPALPGWVKTCKYGADFSGSGETWSF